MPKRYLTVISFILVLFMLAGCGSGSAGSGTTDPGSPGSSSSGSTPAGGGAAPERSRTVTLATARATSIDPNNFRDAGSEVVMRMCYESLIYTDHSGSGYTPMLAKSWEVAPDGLSWTFYLNEGVTFHNGDPFTAADVVYTVDRCIARRDDLAFTVQYLPELESAEMIDEYTVKINLSKKNPMAGNGFRAMYIIPKKAHEEMGDELFHGQYMYGTGPWTMVEWVDGQYAHYRKNENYWNKANFDSYFEEVYIRYIAEQTSGVAAHIAGSIECYVGSSGITQDLLPLYAGTEDRIELITLNTNSTFWFGLSFKEGSIWHDEKVRMAFDAAINRQAIIDNITLVGEVPTGYFHSSVQGYDASLGHPVYDPELAKKLLAESSYDGRPFSLIVSASTAQGEEIFLAIADMVNSVGFNMEVDLIDLSLFTPRQASGDYDIFVINTSIPDGIPQRMLNRIPNNNDKSDYVNEELNSAILKFNEELDDAKRVGYAKQANQMIFELKAPHISLMHRSVTHAINYGIVGIDLYPDGMYNYCYVDYDPSLVH